MAPAPADRRPRDHEWQPPCPQTQRRPSASAGEPETGPQAGTRRIVHVEVLGSLRITAASQEIGGGLGKARELIALLAVHHGKARDMLRAATGMAAPMWIIHASGRYRLDPSLISTDLWQFTAARR